MARRGEDLSRFISIENWEEIAAIMKDSEEWSNIRWDRIRHFSTLRERIKGRLFCRSF